MPTSAMSAPEPFNQPVVEPSVPFENAPNAPAAGGCSRVGLIGCGVVILLLGAAAVVFLFKAGDLFAWAMTQFEVEITKALPEDCTESERQRLQSAFDSAAEAVRSGEFDPLALQRLQGKLRESLLDEDQSLTREQVLELTVVLEEVSGQEPSEGPVEEQTPAPAIAA
jgi:hypothetical protein